MKIVLLIFIFSFSSYAINWKEIDPQKDFLIIRHALAPGIGDPSSFKLDDCSTQRNLNDSGKKQAIKMGEFLNKNYQGAKEVFTSMWCRCRDTANLLKIKKVNDFKLLNSFFRDNSREEKQMKKLKVWLDNYQEDKLRILITHQVVITSLTGSFPSSGEIFWVSKIKGSYKIKGRYQIEH